MPPTDSILPRVGLVGLGRMGGNMARRLKDAGFAVTALYDLDQAVAATLAQELASVAVTRLSEVTARADVILTVVSDDAAMREIYQRAEDSLLMGAAGKLFINCATLSPAVHVALAGQAKTVGARTLEAPMASSIPQARAGTLYLMCAGERAAFEEAAPVLNALAAKSVYTGGSGSAAQIKALVNMVMNINTAGLAEGLGLADALGLDLGLVRQIFAETGANSRVLETDGEDMQNRDHAVYFSAAHAAKDSGIALTLAQAAGLSLPLATATKAQYDRLVSFNLGALDKSGISELTFRERLPESLRLPQPATL